jgi:molybdopterin-guanine dinucleotide biosynthesis protein A
LKIDHIEAAILVDSDSERSDMSRAEGERVALVRQVADGLGACVRQVRLVMPPGDEPPLDLPCIENSGRHRAPIEGIHAALGACESAALMIARWDLGQIDSRLILALLALVPAEGGFDIVAPELSGRFEPLFAVYRPRILPEIATRIAAGELSLQDLLRAVDTFGVPEAELLCFDPELRWARY